jgi:hypothetical protein
MSNKVAGEPDMNVTANWYWKGDVVEAIARFLAQDCQSVASAPREWR